MRANNNETLSEEQFAELAALEGSSPGDAGGAPQPTDTLMQEIRSLGRLPRRETETSEANREETFFAA